MFSLEFYFISPCLIFFIINLHLEELNISGEKQIILTHVAFRNGLWLNLPRLGDVLFVKQENAREFERKAQFDMALPLPHE